MSRIALILALVIAALAVGTPANAQPPGCVNASNDGRPPGASLHPLRAGESRRCWKVTEIGPPETVIEIIDSEFWTSPLRQVWRADGTPVPPPPESDRRVDVNGPGTMIADELIVGLDPSWLPATDDSSLSPVEALAQHLPAGWEIVTRWDDSGNKIAVDSMDAARPILIENSAPQDLFHEIETAAAHLVSASGDVPPGLVRWVEANYLVDGIGGMGPIRGKAKGHNFHKQWGPQHAGSEPVWEKTVGKWDLIVAVVDSGIYENHPDFKDNLWIGPVGGNPQAHGECFRPVADQSCTDPSNIADTTGHGTMVSGLIGAEGSNEEAIAGMAWDLQILTARVLGDDNRGTAIDAARAIEWAVDQGAFVVNASWGGPSGKTVLEEAIKYACGQNVLVVTGAGNDDLDRGMYPFYPASLGGTSGPGCLIVVGGTSHRDAKARGSAYGMDKVDLGAPAVQILSLEDHGSGVRMGAGTSFSAAMVSGALVLLKALAPDWDPYQEFKDCLLDTATRGDGAIQYWPENRVLNLPGAVECVDEFQ